jgi:hypothetical protein
MPAPGSLITVDYQVELQGVLMGALTKINLAPPGIKGLAVFTPKSADVALDLADGSYSAPEFQASRIITVPMVILGDTPADAMSILSGLNVAWSPVAADVPIYMQLPGFGKFHALGRPRGLDEHLEHLRAGVIDVLGTFFCPNPTVTPG